MDPGPLPSRKGMEIQEFGRACCDEGIELNSNDRIAFFASATMPNQSLSRGGTLFGP